MGARDQILKDFGTHLRVLIQRQGYKSPENFFLSQSKVSKASFYKILVGQQECKLTTILALAEALEMSPGILLDFQKSTRLKRN
jgi:hypothetical protein